MLDSTKSSHLLQEAVLGRRVARGTKKFDGHEAFGEMLASQEHVPHPATAEVANQVVAGRSGPHAERPAPTFGRIDFEAGRKRGRVRACELAAGAIVVDGIGALRP
jgi:hypothetical protein